MDFLNLKLLRYSPLALAIFLLAACSEHADNNGAANQDPLFKLLPEQQTHIGFANTLTEGLNTNVLMYEYFYNGGGVAVGDVNDDGKQDIYFTGNMTDNKLYLNQGAMQFNDVTSIAEVAGRPGPWKTGVTMADVNGDGKLDIYVSYSGKISAEKRRSQLFINQGNDSEGIPHFKDEASRFGLDFPSFSTQAYFFDYDRDGDLDMLIVNHNPARISSLDDITVSNLMKQSDEQAGIRLLQNDKNFFKDVTATSGIINTSLSYGLGAGIADLNGDGWPDIYVSNDYNVPDRLYINKHNGKFDDQLQSSIGHTSFYSMGNDVADINNDLKPDIYTLDMLPEDNRRQKLLFGADNYESFALNLRVGFYYQYMRNMLHLNNGDGTYSEIGQLAGISNTDWSWAPLFADYDNDGWKDLFVSNGYTRDYTNLDFLKYMGDNLRDRRVMRQDLLNIVNQMPSSEVKSYFFKNNSDLTFSNTSQAWGINQPANSNGAAYVDLDNDGDLDLVVNNINKPAFIYENQAGKQSKNHYLDISLKGKPGNTQGIGAKAIIYSEGKSQYLEQMPTRGFQSSVSPVLHFGFGKVNKIDSLRITWQSGYTNLYKDIPADKLLTVTEEEAKTKFIPLPVSKPLFQQVSSPIKFTQKSATDNDFKRQPLLTNPLSYSGPCIEKGDVNGDGLEDVFIGGANGQEAALYLQNKHGGFIQKTESAFAADNKYTDAAAAFFDANGDGYPDLYVASGGYAGVNESDPLLQDRLYLNDGKGNFTKAANALPKMLVSKGCVKAADINGDGYIDLFVGGRVIPGRYPEMPDSYLLLNDGKGHFTDATATYNASLKKIGMVTDAAWADMNHDGKPDLILAGEWMPITVFLNLNGKLIDATEKYLGKKYSGWWNCLKVQDINHDGQPDIVAGNLGLNTQCKASYKEPAELYYKDFDDNGSVDPILCFYIQHKSYPYVSRDELLDQLSVMRGRFPDYKSYADATIDKIFTPEEMKGAGKLTANYLGNACFMSDKSGKLKPLALPAETQFAPVFAINVFDYNHDGIEDMLLCGNITHERLRFGKYDANYGVLLKGDTKGGYTYIRQQQSGFKIKGDVRSILQLNNLLLFGLSEGELKAYKPLK
ncbi:VCBS repeat-containing protein [Mucilaginibacter sp. 21P]|uniref:VCBS repeat-containing protein n=1 Tax=Mucilaginibacter sp. 21P TaxID=2778902 RepID=UPI001C57ABDD|nr:VCBS repeat-containing protein [Mucilaginibacter sp. 21P]